MGTYKMDQLNLLAWAAKWQIPPAALRELADMSIDVQHGGIKQESQVQAEIRLAEAKKGNYYYRNNRGAGKLANGSFVRWGLCNDSERVGDRFKSGDLIGIEPTIVTPDMVGKTVGIFGSIEAKRSDWRFSGSKADMAQLAWATLVNNLGGRARIVNHA